MWETVLEMGYIGSLVPIAIICALSTIQMFIEMLLPLFDHLEYCIYSYSYSCTFKNSFLKEIEINLHIHHEHAIIPRLIFYVHRLIFQDTTTALPGINRMPIAGVMEETKEMIRSNGTRGGR